MTLYNVHLYRVMRLFIPGIEAGTPEEAAAHARDRDTADADEITSCDGETIAALVDVAGDDRYEQSVMIDFDYERMRKAVPQLLEALEFVLGCLGSFKPDWLFNVGLDCAVERARAAIASAATTHPETMERKQP